MDREQIHRPDLDHIKVAAKRMAQSTKLHLSGKAPRGVNQPRESLKAKAVVNLTCALPRLYLRYSSMDMQ